MSLLFLVSFNLRYIVCITKITKDIVAKNVNFINPYNKTSINLLSFVITKILKLPLRCRYTSIKNGRCTNMKLENVQLKNWTEEFKKNKSIRTSKLINFFFIIFECVHFTLSKAISINLILWWRRPLSYRNLYCSANQWTGFYMITASVVKELICQSVSII